MHGARFHVIAKTETKSDDGKSKKWINRNTSGLRIIVVLVLLKFACADRIRESGARQA